MARGRAVGRQPEVVRPTQPQDAPALRRFSCSTGAWYEDEVQDLVRGKLADRVEAGFRAWVIEADGEIAAVAAHEARAHPAGTGATVSYLLLLALRADDVGGGLAGAARLTRILRSVFADMLGLDREPFCYTMVAVDNARMNRFCERSGFLPGPVPSDPRYLFYTARLRSDR